MGADGARDDLAAFLAARDDADGNVAPSMRSQIHRGRPGAGTIVLLHGLTASPPAWRDIAAALAARGRTVVVPRLTLHGHADRMTNALRGLTPAALLDDVRALIARVVGVGDDVTIAGHSLGATLAIDAAVNVAGVARIVPIAPFLGIVRVPLELHPLVRGVLACAPDLFLWWDPVQRERLMPAHGYPQYPLRALSTGLHIADAVRVRANQTPRSRGIDLVINDGESSVNNRTALRFAAGARASGASVAVHRVRGLGWSHDIIEPERAPAQAAHGTLVEIIDGPHRPIDRDHRVAEENLT